MARLLVLACSRRKHRSPCPLPAWYRYEGVLFRLCKRLYADGCFAGDVHVRILSAEFGIVSPETPIPWYDQRLDAARAAELRPAVTVAICQALTETGATEVYLGLGRTYRAAIGTLPPYVSVQGATGGIVRMQAQLRQWLAAPPRTGAAQLQLDIPDFGRTDAPA